MSVDLIRPTLPQRLPFYYGWVQVVLAALAMTATLPGRTHGLGLITEPLLRDFDLSRTTFATINLWASLLGASFCLPVGWMIDRSGVRGALVVVVLGLAMSVGGLSLATGPAALLAGLLLTRGFGQSGLSIVSIAMIGKWFRRRLGAAMGLFTALLTIGFIGSTLGVGHAVQHWVTWRVMWQGMAVSLAALALLGGWLTRSTPESAGVTPDPPAAEIDTGADQRDFTLRQALLTPAFWVFVLGTSMFNLVWSAITLFNESILAERGFAPDVAVQTMGILTGVGLVTNLLCGALIAPRRIGPLLGVGLTVLAIGLASFPSLQTLTGVRLYAAALGATGGIVTVVFFAAWAHAFGRGHLGRIQGAAQVTSVFASAIGPVLMAESQARSGSYEAIFFTLAGGTALLAAASFLVPLPNRAVDAPPRAAEALDLPPILTSTES